MKRPTIYACFDEALRPDFERGAHRIGMNLQFFPRHKALFSALSRKLPDLLLFSGEMLRRVRPDDCSYLKSRLATGSTHLVLFGEVQGEWPFPFDYLGPQLDVIELHQLMITRLCKFPRRHLRMSVKLPGLFYQGERCFFGEIVSLGTGGAFIRAGMAQIGDGEVLSLHIPLLGVKKELEVEGKVVYQIHPTPENNYLQGIGVTFTPTDELRSELLQNYIRHALIHDEDYVTADGGLTSSPATASTSPRRSRRTRRVALN
ncbi:MAG: hypothetical protein C0621_06715 [Desulfuromonas sp.]|nr:MAG: hypothetical protein C0621_06715 [Desulfuromonas sp.]